MNTDKSGGENVLGLFGWQAELFLDISVDKRTQAFYPMKQRRLFPLLISHCKENA